MEASPTPAEADNVVDLLAYRTATRGLDGLAQSKVELELVVQNERAHAARLFARMISSEFGGNDMVGKRVGRTLDKFFELELADSEPTPPAA